MSLFDTKSFLSGAIEGEVDTKSIPAPIAQRVPAQVVAMDMTDGKNDAGKPWVKIEARCEITDADYLHTWKLKKEDGSDMEKCIVRYGFFLEVNEGGGIVLGPGKNPVLGRFREATDTNKPGKALDAGIGQMIRIDVVHKVGQSGDPYAEAANPVKY